MKPIESIRIRYLANQARVQYTRAETIFSHLAADVLLDQVVLALVAEDHMHLLRGAANVGTEHDVVRGLTVEVAQVGRGGHDLKNKEELKTERD